MCKNRNLEGDGSIDSSEKKCTGDCKKCPFTAPKNLQYDVLQKTKQEITIVINEETID